MKYVTQMVGLTVQNFVSAAVGMAVVIAFIRGFSAVQATVGQLLGGHDSFHSLHPIASVVHPRDRAALGRVVVQTLHPSQTVQLVQPYVKRTGADDHHPDDSGGTCCLSDRHQSSSHQPAAVFLSNAHTSSHPFENPTHSQTPGNGGHHPDPGRGSVTRSVLVGTRSRAGLCSPP